VELVKDVEAGDVGIVAEMPVSVEELDGGLDGSVSVLRSCTSDKLPLHLQTGDESALLSWGYKMR
jgi:hypothetical protein